MRGGSTHSASLALSEDGATLYVVNPDADSVSFLDLRTRRLVREIALGTAPPQVDAEGRFEPRVQPRMLTLAPGGRRLYVTGQRSGRVYAIDTASGAVTPSAVVCSEPVGVLAPGDGTSVFVACSQDDAVIVLGANDLAMRAQTSVPWRPWGLGWDAGASRLLVTHLLGPGVSVMTPSPLHLLTTWRTADGPPGSSIKVPHGEVRGIYDAVPRPGTTETWVAHMMLATDTTQPALDFETTAFPALSVFDAAGAQQARMSASVLPHDHGAFGDIVSGPHALAFSPDGAWAFVADANSEDVLVVDAARRVQAALVRPLPGHQPEGLVVSSDGHVYVDERNSADIAVLRYSAAGTTVTASVDGAVIPRLLRDPMPARLRLGQHLFYSANSDEYPITQNHWIACASCHIEGHSDAVVWLFREGPRDTPSNAGGTRHTGFLLRTAVRTSVVDYWQTIRDEQGGSLNPDVSGDRALLDALRDYVDLAIPLPVPPRLDAAQVARGAAIFARPEVGCASCHSGPYFTDSAAGNPMLDLAGTVVLHDVGTCNTGAFPDAAHMDIAGHARAACMFDTPTLRGISETAPYLHDGSAATLMDVLTRTRGRMGDISSLSDTDLADLVAYMRSL